MKLINSSFRVNRRLTPNLTTCIICVIWLFVEGCDDYLDKLPPGKLDESTLANKLGLEGLLIGAYSVLDGVGSERGGVGSAASNWIYGSVCGSEAYKGSESDDFPIINEIEKFNATTTNELLSSKWASVFDGVRRTNDVLRTMLKATDLSARDQKLLAGEARFLRAFYHLEVKKVFNKVPFVDETITYENNNYYVSNEPDIWPAIENDLTFAINNLEVEAPAIGRANKFTAMALLAKVHMFQGEFMEAKALLDAVIQSGKYDLTSYHENFNIETKNRKESVFAAQMSVNDYGLIQNGNVGDANNAPHIDGGNTSCCGFFQPSHYFVNHFKTDSTTGLPDFVHFNDVDDISDEGFASDDEFIPYTGTLDPRLDWTIGRRGIPYLDWGNHAGEEWVRKTSSGGPYAPKKGVYYRSQINEYTDETWSAITASNVKLIRYADVLLWAAEVEIELLELDKAQEYINIVRNRAANPAGWVHTYVDPNDPSLGFTDIPAAKYFINPYPDGHFASKGQDYSRKALQFERLLELGMEGHRFFDLVRWKIADTEINAYLEKEKLRRSHLNGAYFEKNCNEYFPIPQSQIDLSAGPDGVQKMKQTECYR